MSVVQLEPTRAAWDDQTVSQLLTLARSRSADDRQRLLLRVTSLCETASPPAELAPVLGDIFLTLTAQAERDIRLALAERIAGADWAPPALINMLALDEIDIARPVITASVSAEKQVATISAAIRSVSRIQAFSARRRSSMRSVPKLPLMRCAVAVSLATDAPLSTSEMPVTS